MSFKTRVIANAGSSWATNAVTAVAGMVLVPFILKDVGKAGYGVWSLLNTGLAYPLILEGVFLHATNRFVAYHRDDPKEFNRYVSTSLAILSVMAFLTILAAAGLSFFICDIFAAIPREMEHDARIVCMLVGATISIKMIQCAFSGALLGFEYYTKYNMVTMIWQASRALLVIAILFFYKSIAAIQIASTIAVVLSTILMIIVSYRSLPGMGVSLRSVDMAALRELTRYTVHSLARQGSVIVMQATLALLLGWKGKAEDCATYDLASRIPGFLRSLLATTQNVFLPAVASLCAKKQFETVRHLARQATHMSSVLACASTIMILAFARELLELWLRQPAAQETIDVMWLVMMSVIPGGLFEVWIPVLVGVGHLRGMTIASLLTAGTAIGMTAVCLIWKIVTPAAAPAVALVLVLWVKTGLWMPWYGCKMLEMRLGEYLKTGVSRSILSAALAVLGLWAMRHVAAVQEQPWLVRFVASGLMVSAVFAVFALRREATEALAVIRKRFSES